jgi:large subunit ribosomal protein L6
MSLPQRCARQLLREPFQRGSLPIFLAPAFSPSRTQCFSTTSPAQSRVGGAALTIPPEVSFKLVDLPNTQSRTRGKDIPKFAAEIKGPRGMCCGIAILRMQANNYRRDDIEHSLIPYYHPR